MKPIYQIKTNSTDRTLRELEMGERILVTKRESNLDLLSSLLIYDKIILTENRTLKTLISLEMGLLSKGLAYWVGQFELSANNKAKLKVEFPDFEAVASKQYEIRRSEYLTDDLRTEGFVISEYYMQQSNKPAIPRGREILLSIFLNKLPKIDFHSIKDEYMFKDYIDFIDDEETKVKKRRMFSWFNELERKIEKNDIKVEDIPLMMMEKYDSYIEHIKLSKIKYELTVSEIILNLPSTLVLALSCVGLPKATKQFLKFKEAKLKLREAEKNAPGRELAYIEHINQNFGNF